MNQFRIIETYFGYQSAIWFFRSRPPLWNIFFIISWKTTTSHRKKTHCFQPIPQNTNKCLPKRDHLKRTCHLPTIEGLKHVGSEKNIALNQTFSFSEWSSFFSPETNIAPCPQAFPKGNSSSNPRVFHVLQYLGFKERYSFVFRRV